MKNTKGVPSSNGKSKLVPVLVRHEATEVGGIVNSHSAPCARVDCLPYSSQSGYVHIHSSQTTGARPRVRESGAAIRCREAYFRAWRIAKFGGNFDPIRRAVDEAVAAFSLHKNEVRRESDRLLWLKIANRIGLDAFLDAFDQKVAEIHELEGAGKRLRCLASSFQKLLNKRFPKDPPSPKASAAALRAIADKSEDKGGAA